MHVALCLAAVEEHILRIARDKQHFSVGPNDSRGIGHSPPIHASGQAHIRDEQVNSAIVTDIDDIVGNDHVILKIYSGLHVVAGERPHRQREEDILQDGDAGLLNGDRICHHFTVNV